MSTTRPIQFRAVHDKTRWRKASHTTARHATRGTSAGYSRSASALLDNRNSAIDYATHGQPRYVIVWKPGAASGSIFKRDSSVADGVREAGIPISDIERFENGEHSPSDAELERYFVRSYRKLPVPTAVTAQELEREFEEQVKSSIEASPAERLRRLSTADPLPQRIEVRATQFVRNPDVVAEVLLRAGGKCEGCRGDAPFKRRTDGTPYLEVHHRRRLADGGPDTVENAVALCPNCHRQRHYGSSAT